MRISDWSSDVCSSDLGLMLTCRCWLCAAACAKCLGILSLPGVGGSPRPGTARSRMRVKTTLYPRLLSTCPNRRFDSVLLKSVCRTSRSEEHTSELQSLMRISYAVFCLKKKQYTNTIQQ